jgi:hypothetical protein
LGITISFIALSSLVLWFVIGSRGIWGLKMVAIASSIYLMLSIAGSMDEFRGWPTVSSMPEKFQVHWVIIDEPNYAMGHEGAIYIWATPNENGSIERDGWMSWLVLFRDDNDGHPRAYKIPYGVRTHERLEPMMAKIKDGDRIIGMNLTEEGDGSEEGDSLQDLIFYDFPKVKMQQK